MESDFRFMGDLILWGWVAWNGLRGREDEPAGAGRHGIHYTPPHVAQPDVQPLAPPRAPAAGAVVLVGAGVLTLLFLALAAFGLAPGQPALAGMFSAASVAAGALPLAAAYFLAGLGLGRPLAWVVARRSASRVWIQSGLGTGTMLWVSHLCGMLGVGRILAWPVVVLGLALVLDQAVRGMRAALGGRVGRDSGTRRTKRPWGTLVWALPLAIMLIAACNPPGALWRSEFGGYDALSYHLQLAKEWSAGGHNIRPVAHNVYSYLPSYMESAFAHLAWLVIPSGSTPEGGARVLLGVNGWWAYACQMLHGMYGLAAALLVGRCVFRAGERMGLGCREALAGAGLAGAVLLATPWTVVVGSLAYNELAVLAMVAAGMLIAIEDDLPVMLRGAACGWVAGLACSAKPTALLLACPMIGVLLVMGLPRRPVAWAKSIGAGVVMGLLAMVPWLVRNTIASGGNPVFPLGAKLFGGEGRGVSGWTAEQLARYSSNHAFSGSIGERLAMLVEERGFGNGQWALVPVVGVAAIGFLLSRRASHLMGVALATGVLAGVGAWLAFTHLQSRFLLPLLPGLAAAIGLAAGLLLSIGEGRRSSLRIAALMTALPTLLAAHTFRIFAGEIGGRPNATLVTGVPGLSGDLWLTQLKDRPLDELMRHLSDEASPAGYLNALLLPEGRVYLLGDATPLYMLAACGDRPGSQSKAAVFYHTTWDTSLLGQAIGSAADDPGAWSKWFVDHGIDSVLVNYSELSRLIEKDHYYDPAVTTARVRTWLGSPAAGLRSMRRWEREVPMPDGRTARVPMSELFQIRPALHATTPANGGTP